MISEEHHPLWHHTVIAGDITLGWTFSLEIPRNLQYTHQSIHHLPDRRKGKGHNPARSYHLPFSHPWVKVCFTTLGPFAAIQPLFSKLFTKTFVARYTTGNFT